jgi:hypothetical protein
VLPPAVQLYIGFPAVAIGTSDIAFCHFCADGLPGIVARQQPRYRFEFLTPDPMIEFQYYRVRFPTIDTGMRAQVLKQALSNLDPMPFLSRIQIFTTDVRHHGLE